jgi:tetratricopeptide (TPR) repeat protein
MSEFITHHKKTKQKPIDQSYLPQTKFIFNRPHGLQAFICFFLILMTLTAFWQVRNNEFINLDDDLYVMDNLNVQKGLTLKGIIWAFTSIHAGHWHPMTWLSHMLDYNLYGMNPGGHHMTNLFFHIANTLVLFLLLQQMTGASWRTGFVAALFALHPLHVESVAWVAERKDVLSAFFFLLTIRTYVGYVKRPKLERYLLVVLCFVLADMSKPMAVTLPFVLLLLDYWPLGRLQFKNMDDTLSPFMNTAHYKVPFYRLVLEKVPLFFLTAALSLLTMLAQWKAGAVTTLGKLPIGIRIGNALISYVIYIAKMIWPVRLAVLYPHPIILPLWEVAGAGLLLLMISVLVILTGRKRPYYIVGWLWYLGTLVPVIGLVQAGIQAMADRFTYIPLIGLFIMAVYGIPDILTERYYRKVALAISGSLLLLILMTATILQLQHWQNSVKLFNHTLDVTVNNFLIQNNLGVTLARQRKDEEAEIHYRKALEIKSNYADAHYNLGILLARHEKNEEASVHFVETLRINPNKVEAHNDLGVILSKRGKIQEAIDHFSEAVRINPNYGEAQFNLGTALVHQGRNEEALPYFTAALRINPKDLKVYNNLGLALARQGKIRESIVHYTYALQINPDYIDAHYNLGALLARQGKDQEAITHYTEVLRINPNDAQVHYEIGLILTRQGRNQEAVVHLTEVLRIIPNHGEAHLALGMLFLKMKKKELAFTQYKILQTINKNLANTLYQNISKNNNWGSTRENR